MAIAQGYRSAAYLGWDEDIHNDLTAPDFYRVPFMTNNLTYTQALNESAVLRGVRATARPFFGNKTAEGNLDVPFDADVSGIVFKAMCGNSTSKDAVTAIDEDFAVWTASSTYKVGDIVKDSDTATGVLDTYFICTKAGTSDATEPTWTSVVGDEFVDGTVEWVASQDYVHKFWVDVNALPYMFVEKTFPDIEEYVVYRGLKANTVSLDVGGDGEMMMGVSMMGVRADDIAQTSISEAGGDETDLTVGRFQFQNFKADLSSSVMTADELNAIMDVSIEFNNNLQGDIYTINSRGARREIPEGMMAISGSINALFENTSMIVKATDGTEIDMTFSFVEGNHLCRIDIPEARIEPFDPSVDGPEGVTASINFIAYSDDDMDAPVTITLTNGIASYDPVI